MKPRLVVALEEDGAIHLVTDDALLAREVEVRLIDNTVTAWSGELQSHVMKGGYRVEGGVYTRGILHDPEFVSDAFLLPESTADVA